MNYLSKVILLLAASFLIAGCVIEESSSEYYNRSYVTTPYRNTADYNYKRNYSHHRTKRHMYYPTRQAPQGGYYSSPANASSSGTVNSGYSSSSSSGGYSSSQPSAAAPSQQPSQPVAEEDNGGYSS